MPSWGMKRLVFTLGSMSHSRVSSIGSESWEVNQGWRDGSVIWFIDFPTSVLMHGGTPIDTGKGRGQGKKGVIGSSFEIRGVSWFTRGREA